MKLTADVRLVHEAHNLVGECPLWHAGEQALYWVDTRRPAIQRLRPDGSVEAWPLPHKIGSFAFRERGGFVAAMQVGFCELDLDPFTIRAIVDPEPDRPNNRLNDGKCDRAGRFWCGSRDPTDHNPGGALYRLDPDWTVTRIDTGFIISNGMAFSPDDRTLVFGDSAGEVTYRYDLDLAAGTVANRRPYLRTAGLPWRIDGAAFDEDGHYWCALIGDSAVARFDPDGRLDRIVRLPVSHPTMCNFGGPDLDILYVTSGTIFLDAEACARQPLAGALFAVHGLGTRGIPEPFFTG
ncbi:L-arabinolactonase [Methylobacterium brachiatum]|nr:L-arabinolactonase [Methylobacterium brachiatum]